MGTICPHCGLDSDTLSEATFEHTINLSLQNYSDATKDLIWKVFQISNDLTRKDLLKFLVRIKDFTDEEVRYGLSQFFKKEMPQKGYGWQYAAGFVKRENEVRKQQRIREAKYPSPKEV